MAIQRPASYAAAVSLVTTSQEVRARSVERVGEAVVRFSWPPVQAPAVVQAIESTMAQIPTLMQQTVMGASVMAPQLVPPLRTLQAWLDEPFASGEARAIADEALERTYAALRVLACIPGALSVQGIFNLLLVHDVVDAVPAARLDAAIVARFPGTILVPVVQLAQQLQQLQMATAAGANERHAHPVYGNVTTDQVVKYEMARYGIV